MPKTLNHYLSLKQATETHLTKIESKITKTSHARLLLFIAGIAGWFIFEVTIALPVFLMLAIGFTLIMRHDTKNRLLRQQLKAKSKLSQLEIESFHTPCELFDDGTKYVSGKHPYSSDLDLFGANSVFHRINRCFTPQGCDTLAQWLSNTGNKEEVLERQTAVKELANNTSFRTEIGTTGILTKEKQKETDSSAWTGSHEKLRLLAGIKRTALILTCLNIGLLITSMWRSELMLVFSLLFSISYYYIYGRQWPKVASLFQTISKTEKSLKYHEHFIKTIESEQFDSRLLSQLQKALLIDGKKGVKTIKKIQRLIKWTDFRLNMVFLLIVNSIFYTDIWLLHHIEKWKIKHGQQLVDWQNTIGQFEALISLATLHFNHPQWCFPEVCDTFGVALKNFGHPLIPKETRITNNYILDSNKKVDILTGSNMSGKSTLLRSVGVNIVLALAGAPVCAEQMTVSPIRLMTYMRISDSLEDSTSTFYAEIKRLRKLLEVSHTSNNAFLLLDELLRGTNSMDRTKGAMAIIKKIIADQSSAIVATHDLTITDLQETYPQNIRTFYLDINIKDGRMFFDYKLKDGVCQSANASLLLREIGLEVE